MAPSAAPAGQVAGAVQPARRAARTGRARTARRSGRAGRGSRGPARRRRCTARRARRAAPAAAGVEDVQADVLRSAAPIGTGRRPARRVAVPGASRRWRPRSARTGCAARTRGSRGEEARPARSTRQLLAAADRPAAGRCSASTPSSARNTASIDGTKCMVVTPLGARSGRAGRPASRCPPGSASDQPGAGDERPEELPHRHVEAGRASSAAPRRRRRAGRCAASSRSRLTMPRWVFGTPFGRPVEPEV